VYCTAVKAGINIEEETLSLDRVLEQSMLSVPDCIAAAYVDMSTGLLLAVTHVGNYDHGHLEFVAAKTADIFQGPSIAGIEETWKKYRKQPMDDHHFFQEIIILSDNQLHMFIRCKRHADHAIVFITRKSANIGMVIAKSRAAIEPLENAL
jgi:hypothetical protein